MNTASAAEIVLKSILSRAAACAVAVLGTLPTLADVAPPAGTKVIEVCHRLETPDFGDYVFVGHTASGPNEAPNAEDPVTLTAPVAAECLPSGYRAGYRLAAVLKTEWAEKGGSTKVELLRKDVATVGIDTDESLGLPSSSAFLSRTKIWAVAGRKDGKVHIYLAKSVDTFSDRAKPLTTTYPKPGGF